MPAEPSYTRVLKAERWWLMSGFGLTGSMLGHYDDLAVFGSIYIHWRYLRLRTYRSFQPHQASMGVYYRCSQCKSALHLSPQSPGFGRMKVTCFLCGGDANYNPSGPPPGVQVVNAPEGPLSSEGWQSVARSSSGVPAVPNPTVPLQTPAELLELDAEAAPTIPVGALKDEDFERLGLKAEEDAVGTIRYVAKDKNDIEEYIPTRSVAGLASRPITSIGGLPGDEEEQIPTRAVAGLADKLITHLPPEQELVEPQKAGDIEEEIPTRAVSGLADKRISSYAEGLYNEQDLKEIENQPSDGSIDEIMNGGVWDSDRLLATEKSWDASSEPVAVSRSWDNSKPGSEPALALSYRPTVDSEPALAAAISNKIKSAAPPETSSFGGISPGGAKVSAASGPSFGLPEPTASSSGPSGGLGHHPSLLNMQAVRPPDSLGNSTFRVVAVGVLFVLVFIVILGGLIAYKNPQLFGGIVATPEKVEAEEEEEEAKDPKKPEVVEVIDPKKFDLEEVDPDSPFRVVFTNVLIRRDDGKEVTVKLEGKITYTGKESLTTASVAGKIGVERGTTRESFGLKKANLTPALSKSKPWKKDEKRSFVVSSSSIPKTSIDDDARKAFFAWITLKGKGKKYTYDKPIHTQSLDAQKSAGTKEKD